MSLIKIVIRKLFSAFGLDIVSKERGRIRAENFQNLIAAYQYQLDKNCSVPCRPGNDLRAKTLERLLGTSPSQAFEIIMALSRTADIHGDVCEFGVAQGETSAMIANEILDGAKNLHLFDSFEGLPAPTDKDQLKDDIFSLGSIDAYKGEMSCPLDLVKNRLASIDFPKSRYRIHKGFIEELITTKSDFPAKVSFAYVDFDFYEPIKVALDFLDSTLVKGGVVMVDDYDFFSTGAKIATDEFIDGMNSERQKYELEIAEKQLGYFAMITKL